ncbi:TonB-dependent receptor [Catalinimonas sp. 4WD22]|uniref:SusC/RagA family TonB-linked outer membrane protein n=1 Tax=Catalinimonas locisalis TaxID=3133978 RepID=UPI00310129BD
MVNFVQKCTNYLVVALICCYQSGAMAQQLAAVTDSREVHHNEPASEKVQNQQQLKQVLEEIGTRYEVNFMFDQKVVEKKIVNKSALNFEDFDQLLSHLLEPLGLTYKKIDESHYIIKAAEREEKAIQKVEARNSINEEREGVISPVFSLGMQSVSQKMILAKTITGKVTDENNDPLPGVSILVKNTTTGTVTDIEGNYRLNVSDDATTLVFSSVGYTTEEVAIGDQNVINVSLVPDIQALGEVVVVGYGEVKRTDLTGSVVSMDAEQLEKVNKVDAVSSLQGQVPGVVIQRTDNKPGSGGFNIRIRGASTINTNETAAQGGFNPGQNPLFIVDGIFVDDISFLNPADIERMDVLKDASATAIYGSRGSNGVVIIKTKRGSEGKLSVRYNNYVGVKQAYHLPPNYNGPEYVEFLKDVVVGNQFASGDLDYRREDVVLSDYLDEEEMQNVADGVNTDWVDLILQNGFQTNHTVDLSGGSETTVYGVGFGYTKDEGNIEGEDFTRFNLRGNFSSDLADWLNLSYNNYVTMAIQNTGSWEAFRSAYRLKPIGRPYNEDGTLKFWPTQKETQITNPLFDPANITKEDKYLQYLGDIALKITPLEGLTFTTKFSPNIKFTRYGEYRGLYSKSTNGNIASRRAQVNNFNYFSYTWDNIANYSRSFGNIHNLNATLVYSQYMERRESYFTQVRNFSTDDYKFYNLDAGLDINDLSSDFAKQSIESYTARVNYGLLDKYLFTLTGRYDGASILSDQNKWAFFPSAAFAWRIVEEDFMSDQNIFSEAKLRLSYGQTGNNGQGGGLSPLGSQSLLVASSTNLGDASVQTLYINSLANADLTWERTTEVNLGIDFGFLNNRIYGSIDVYNRKNTDIIFFRPLPSVTGFGGTFDNVGESTNKGIEFGLNTVNFDNNAFKWTTNFNFSLNRNTIDKLYGGLDDIMFTVQGTSLINRVGEPIGSIYNYELDGVWQLDEADEAAKYDQFPGQVKVVDQNDDGQITPEEDRVIIGNVTPIWTGGITSTMNYKNFDFSFFVYTSQGNKIRSNFHNATSFPWDNVPSRVFNGYKIDYWTPTNPTDEWYQPGNGGQYQDVIKYRDVSFTKVGYITLGYTLPGTLLDRLNLGSLRMYATVQDPFIMTDYDGWDPENAGRNDWGAAFMSRTYMAGINLSF